MPSESAAIFGILGNWGLFSSEKLEGNLLFLSFNVKESAAWCL